MGALWEGLKQGLGSSLGFFYDLVPSYGLGIVLLTVAINLVLFPLTLKQTRATRAFQSIQPEVRRLQKELKDKPEDMQRELLRVQREAGATPGGCLLPILVQMPIWFALFSVLNDPLTYIPSASGLHAAVASSETGFLGMQMGTSPSQSMALGILTAVPYLMMMLVMVATQYVQQWHATYGQQTTGPQQQAAQTVTKIMPLFIGIISWNFPAGLGLYWATSNIFRLAQQIVIFRIDGRPEPITAAVLGEDKEPASDSGAGPARVQPGSVKKRRRRRRS